MATSKSKKTNTKTKWAPEAIDPPKLSSNQWAITGVLGAILLAMAVLQLVSFTDFKDSLSVMGLASPGAWGAAVIAGELWGAAAFFPLRLSWLFRFCSAVFAVFVAAFWFYENIRLVVNDVAASNVGFFGRFLAQEPGWWTVLMSTILLTWTLYAVNLTRVSRPK